MTVRIDVSLTRKVVLEVLKRRIENNEAVTQEAIAEEIGCHSNTVYSAIRDLTRAGKVRIIQRGNPYVQSQYEILENDHADDTANA